MGAEPAPTGFRPVPAEKASAFARRLEFVGPTFPESETRHWHIWGCSPIDGPDGRVHLFCARWPLEQGHKGWETHSEIAHAVADRAEGPFRFLDVVLRGRGGGAWNAQAPHNPTIHKVGDRYALCYIARTIGGTPKDQRIGLLASRSLDGPWKAVGDGPILSPSDDVKDWDYDSRVGVNNPALLLHPDGRFWLYYKAIATAGGARRMGLAIADTLEGPYRRLPQPVASTGTEIEDGYAFHGDGKFYLLTTDNHGAIKTGAGLLFASDDGQKFGPPLLGFDTLAGYPGTEVTQEPEPGSEPKLRKFERPQLLIRNGQPAFLYVASGKNFAEGRGSNNYVLRVKPAPEKISTPAADGPRLPTASHCFDVRDYGASGDGSTLGTKAIQQAIDACHAAGGGKVILAQGRYRTGTLFLKSNVTLCVEAGAELLGSTSMADYAQVGGSCPYFVPPSHLDKVLVYAEEAENVGLAGRGLIDGQFRGEPFAQIPDRTGPPERPMLVRFNRCRNVLLRDLTFQGSCSWCINFVQSANIKIDRVSIFNDKQDGFNLESCQEVSISNCNLKCGDDGIALTTSAKDRPLRNMMVSNCTISSRWAAVRFGPLSRGNYENIAISNCVFHDCAGGGLKIGMFEGAEIRNVVVSDIVMDNVTCPIGIFLSDLPPIGLPLDVLEPIGRIHDLQFNNIRATAVSGNRGRWYPEEKWRDGKCPDDRAVLFLHGSPEHDIENITLRNVRVTFPGGGTPDQAQRRDMPDFPAIPKQGWPEHRSDWGIMPAYGLYARHVRGLRVIDCRFDTQTPEARPAVFCHQTSDVRLTGTEVQSPVGPAAGITLRDTHDALIRGSALLDEGACFLRVEDAASSIGLMGNDLRRADRPVELGDGCVQDAVLLESNLARPTR